MKNKFKKIIQIYLLAYPITVFLYGLFHAVFGFESHPKVYGLSGFFNSLDHIFYEHLILSVIFLALWLCGIAYLIFDQTKYKQPKKILFYLSILVWILYLAGGIYFYFDGFSVLFNVSYGFEAMLSYYLIIGLILVVIPILPVSLFMMIMYLIQSKKNKLQ